MRPIYWGIIFFIIGALGWVLAVVIAAITFGAFKFLANFFGVLFAISLPVALIWEFARWVLKNKQK